MKYSKFTIKNYKGIRELTLDLNISPDTKIYTLVGLNESGKTTILEAISDFEFEVPDVFRHLLIPKSSAGGFSDDVLISAEIELSEEDKNKIIEFIKSKSPSLKNIVVENSFTLDRSYPYKNSVHQQSERTYVPFITTKSTKSAKPVDLEDALGKEVWQFVKKELFPEIIFYRDFLSKFPEKIYLQPTPSETKDKEYLSIIEDVLTSINPEYTLQESVINRLLTPTDSNKQALEAVENELSAKITSVVFEAWSKIQKVSRKEIIVKTSKEEPSGRFYIKISVKEGSSSYAISERSLGFRWFFTFLLYTEFRKERIQTDGEILFLLDEPASNLHQKAQISILDTFRTIVSRSRLVYTTHSHHLINPEWLGTTYIIRNKGLNDVNENDFNSTKTEVEAYKYKQFVSQYPTETSYFQPILDVLDYQPGLLEHIPNIVITEGKNDFFVLKYFKDVVLKDHSKYQPYPGQGASNLALPIALYESWGRKYCVLIDSDKEGNLQKAKYISEISSPEKIFTLADVDPQFENMSMEDLFSPDEKLKITQEFNPGNDKYDKSAFNTGIQTLFSEKRTPDYVSATTKEKFRLIVTFLSEYFQKA